MKSACKLLPALLAIAMAAAPAFAQQPSRRGGGTSTTGSSSRQDSRVERQQNRVDNVQRPTNQSNQGATDQKVRESWSTATSGGSRTPSSGNVNRNSGTVPPGSGTVSGGAQHRAGGSTGSTTRPSNGNTGNVKPSTGGSTPATGNTGGQPPVRDGNAYSAPSQGGNRPANGGATPPGSQGGMRPSNGGVAPPPGSQGGMRPSNGGATPPPPPGDPGMNMAKRPKMPPVTVYSRPQVYERTNAASIVVTTTFRTKLEAYEYITALLDERYYSIGSYGTGYGWLMSDIAYIPTPFDWTNPMTHNQFRMRFGISRSCSGLVKVTITAEWRESVLTDSFSRLRFQPSDSYSTYYAWSVMEDIAAYIPHTRIIYR